MNEYATCVILSQIVKSDISHGGYEVSVSYNSGLILIYYGEKLLYEDATDFIYKKEKIKSVIFEKDLTIDTVDGKIILTDIYQIKSAKGDASGQ